MNLTRVEKLEKIIHLNTQLNRSDDFNNILNIILNETEEIFNVEGTSILLKDETTGNLHFYIVTGEKKDELDAIQIEYGEGVGGHVFQSGKPLIENDPQNSAFFTDKVDKATDFQTNNVLAVPLTVDDKTIGVLELVNRIEGDFTQDDLEFLEFVATQVSITLERAKNIEEKIKSERLASIGEAIAGLSHCVRNILNGLQGGASIIETEIIELDNDLIKNAWEIINPNIDRISDLVLSMLEYSKERQPEYQKTDLNNIVNEIVGLEEHNEEHKKTTIELDLQPDLGKIDVDPGGIFRCLLNLVSNALDATLDKESGLVSISTKRKDDLVEIEISDNGSGIEEKHLGQLFTKFFSTKGSRGTGLGLPTSHKIITEHKGNIHVTSEVGKGTTFIVQLPVKKT